MTTNSKTPNSAQQLVELGTSVWYDNISRDILENGEMKRLIAEWGVRGLTSNPTIFDKAISSSSLYDATIQKLKATHPTPDKIFEELAVQDIAAAADLLRPIFDSSDGVDGFVSIEVSPLLAANTEGTIQEGVRLYEKLARPNIMIKVPGTPDGIPAVFALLEKGINVNITLLFSVDNYVKVAQVYCDALRARVKKGLPVDKIRSVASFFVSRVDTAVDAKLDAIAQENDPARAELARALRGQLGVANSRAAYKRFQEIFEGDAFADLRAKGAKPQRPLWASTGTKDPKYRDVVYVEELIGPETVNTMPHQTLAAFVEHGVAKSTITKDVATAVAVEGKLKGLGIDVDGILDFLQTDGVKKFSESFRALNESISKKLGQ